MKKSNKIRPSMVIGCCMIFSCIAPPVGFMLMMLGGALAVSWYIDDSDHYVTDIDALYVTLLTCLLPFIGLILLQIYFEFTLGNMIVLPAVLLFSNILLGQIVCSLSVRNRELLDAQLLSTIPTDFSLENLSPAARATLLAAQQERCISASMADKQTVKIKTASLPTRCEICHQSDLFDPLTNHCARCVGLR